MKRVGRALREQYTTLHKAFTTFDTNGDGWLSQSEMEVGSSLVAALTPIRLMLLLVYVGFVECFACAAGGHYPRGSA